MNNTDYDIIVIGAGPAGIFTALELVIKKSKFKIAIFEQGKSLKQRSCPKSKTNKCVNCKPYCNITAGFSGAGAFSDGKLSLSPDVGGDLPNHIKYEKVRDTIEYTDKIYLDYGADTKVEGVENADSIKEIRKRAIFAGLKLIDCPIRHIGTEKARELYLKIEDTLISNGVELHFNNLCDDLIITDNQCSGVHVKNVLTGESAFYTAKKIVMATGRNGAGRLSDMCANYDISHRAGTVDIGVRVEVRNEIMEEVNNALYESKLIGYIPPFNDKVRTFCQNPGGFVSQENYDGGLAVVNGHSFKHHKSANTNLAILSSHNFKYPFDRPIDYAQKVAEMANMLGDGKILVQRFGDIIQGKRTWAHELMRTNIIPTLKDAVAGDITCAIPFRPMLNIINFIKAMDHIVPGFAGNETLLYAPEIKFYSNKIQVDEFFMTSIKNLYVLGDSGGLTRGLMMASVMGVIMADNLLTRGLVN
ncbi:MAG: FAD-dependent oxidoreductase [Christensenellaceae bacterium]|jgi:uncharacterized FAD-dependent dehydrogenase|nr:FAD-dependent oxidoreductase [Christensenellaceae bacterium]